jgi:prepilin-type N-terminal cleavage/methylation domain-containing protein
MGNKASHSFTLMELLVVMVMIGILALIAYPAYIGLEERAKVTKDMNNLRQIGIATQMYMNDNDGSLFSPATPWMAQLHPKYLSSWSIFLSPFDNPVSPRTASEDNTNSAVSYGVNRNIYPDNTTAISADKITKPTVFILFAPAQTQGATVSFLGTAGTNTFPFVTALGIGSGQATSTPDGSAATAGTQNNRTRIDALFADLHCETMPWTTFTSNTASQGDPDAGLRWTPYTPYP